MQIIDHPSFLVYDKEDINKDKAMKRIETMGRLCYLSDSTGDPATFIRHIVERGHTSVLEHHSITLIMTVDRAIQLELVRHRISSYSAQSTRYVKYNDKKEVSFIMPVQIAMAKDERVRDIWKHGCETSVEFYDTLTDYGCKPETSRSLLVHCLSSKIAITKNVRAWRETLALRCEAHAHPDMRLSMIPVLLCFKEYLPDLFYDIPYDEEFWNAQPFGTDWRTFCDNERGTI